MGVVFESTVERMRLAGNLRNNSKIAHILGITPQAISNYKKKGELPASLVLKFADIYGLNVDWLLRGEGDIYREGYEGETLLKAQEEAHPYGVLSASKASELAGLAGLTPDELIYVGKLLNVLRGENQEYARGVKYMLKGS